MRGSYPQKRLSRELPFAVPAILCLAAISACRPTDPRSDAPSPRIVSLLPNATETLFALGLGDHVVGASRYCDRPEAARLVPRVGGILDVSLEAVIASRPDLVIASPSVLRGHLADTLSRLGVRVLPLTFESIGEVLAGIRSIGSAVNRLAEAEALLAQIEADLANLEGRARRSPRIRVLFVAGRSPLVVAGPRSFLGEILERMGVENVVKESAIKFPTWSLEQVMRADPDVVIDAAVEAPDLAADLSFAGLEAGRRPRVLRPPDPAVIRPGPALPRAGIKLAEAILQAME